MMGKNAWRSHLLLGWPWRSPRLGYPNNVTSNCVDSGIARSKIIVAIQKQMTGRWLRGVRETSVPSAAAFQPANQAASVHQQCVETPTRVLLRSCLKVQGICTMAAANGNHTSNGNGNHVEPVGALRMPCVQEGRREERRTGQHLRFFPDRCF
jgi:hypothetical protein